MVKREKNIQVNEVLHGDIKLVACQKRMKLKEYVEKVLIEAVNRDRND